MNRLTTLLHQAVCLQGPGSVQCACGKVYDNVKYGVFTGFHVAEGCYCDPANTLANIMWQDRHAIADYLRLVAESFDDDRRQLLGELPRKLGVLEHPDPPAVYTRPECDRVACPTPHTCRGDDRCHKEQLA